MWTSRIIQTLKDRIISELSRIKWLSWALSPFYCIRLFGCVKATFLCILVIFKLFSQKSLASYWFFMCFDQFSFYIFSLYSVQWCWSICPNYLFWIIYDNFSIWLGQYPNFPFGYDSGFGQKSSRQDWFDRNTLYYDQFINYFCLHNWWSYFAAHFLIVS